MKRQIEQIFDVTSQNVLKLTWNYRHFETIVILLRDSEKTLSFRIAEEISEELWEVIKV